MFAGETNSVILAGVEFSEAAKEYAIVFTQAGDQVVPVAIAWASKRGKPVC